ncbi:FtsX-like permease family protein [Cellulomonas sp. Marseille-Q8402]
MSAGWAADAAALALHRARAQARLLVAVTATALVALTVLGVCGLLLTSGRRDALDGALAEAGPGGTQVVVRVVPPVGAGSGDVAALVPDVVATATGAVAPLPATSTLWTESPLLALPRAAGPGGPGGPGGPDDDGQAGFAYLTDAPELPGAARLVTGDWPAGTTGTAAARDVAVPAATADALGLAVGDVLALAPSPEAPDAPDATAVRVVGVFAPLDRGAAGTPLWQRDLLRGAGADLDHPRPGTSGRQVAPAYGPFVVAPGSLADAGTGVGAVSVVVRPDPAGAAVADLQHVAQDVSRLRIALDARLGDRADRTVVRSSLPATVRATAAQDAVSAGAVLTAGLVGAALAGAALLLAGRLLAARRAPERTLQVDRGARERQLAGLAVTEAAAVAVVAGVLAVPLALLAYRGLTAVPLLAEAGIASADGVPAALVATVGAGAAALVVALVAPAARPSGGRRASVAAGRRLARSGGDLLLVVLAVLAAVRLRGEGPVDAVRVLAPVLALVAASVVVLRLVPLLGRLAERGARRSRRFVLPLAALDVARRPRAATALLLLVLATAGAAFGAGWAATWSRSQAEQADALVPAAVVAADVPGAPAAQGALVRSSAGEDALPVTDRATGFGTAAVAGEGDAEPRLLAVDTTAAAFAGRLPAGTTWAGLTAGLAPDDDELAAALPFVASGDGLTLRVGGTTGSPYPMSVLPTVVLDDGHGVRVRALGERVPLDGAEHTVRAAVAGAPAALGPEARVLAVALRVFTDVVLDEGQGGVADVVVDVGWDRPAPDGTSAPATSAGGWSATPTLITARDQSLTRAEVAVSGTGLRATARAAVSRASYLPAVVVLSAFPSTPELPVVVSADLAAAAGVAPGDRLDVLVAGTSVPAAVTAVAPYVPGAVGGPAVLADLRTLSRVAIGQAETSSLVDRWWLPARADVAALRDAGAEVTVRAEVAAGLRGGPLRVGVLAALGLLVVAAVALALVGTALHAAETAEDRGPEVARLLAVGASSRAVAGTYVVQHVVVDVLAVAAGTAAGAAVARALAPALTVSPSGGRPAPEALPVWSWPAAGLLAGLLIAGSAAVVLPVVTGLVRRASAAHLRLGDAE